MKQSVFIMDVKFKSMRAKYISLISLFLILNCFLAFELLAQHPPVKNDATILKRNCFRDHDRNGVCDNYENKRCRKADFNFDEPNQKSNRCDGSGYTANEKKKLEKVRKGKK